MPYKDLEKRREYNREWMRQSYHDSPEHHREIWRNYYQRNAEKIKDKSKERYWGNVEERREVLRAQREKDPLLNKRVPKKYQNLPEDFIESLFEDYKKTRKQLCVFCKEKGISYNAIRAIFRDNFPDEYAEVAEKKVMKSNKYYRAGKRFESRVKNHLEDYEYRVSTSARSGGFFDLVAIHKKRTELLLIECRRGGRISPSEKEKLIDISSHARARPVLASRKTRKKINLKDLSTEETFNGNLQLWLLPTEVATLINK